MPVPEGNDRFDTAVLWTVASLDGYGRPRFASPQEITVRWLTKRKQATNSKGETVMLDATAIVDQDIPIGSAMALGTLVDFMGTGTADAVNRREVMEVISFNKTADIKGREYQRDIGMMKYRETPPTLA